MVYLENVLSHSDKAGALTDPTQLSSQSLSDSDQALSQELSRELWQEFLAPCVFWQPLTTADGQSLGGLLLVREQPWGETQSALLAEIADVAAHAWSAFGHSSVEDKRKRLLNKRRVIIAIAALAIVILCLPVRLSVIAPAEVIAKDATVIAAPINGVIKEVLIKPNVIAARDQVLFSYEDAELRANYDVARLAAEEAQAQLRRASQQAFADPKGRAQVALLKARVALRREQMRYSAYQLGQVQVKAPVDGIVIFSDPNQWRGRPVSTGERVMAIAEPSQAELVVYIPVADAIALNSGTDVILFLDVDPLKPLAATLIRSAYQPESTPEGVLAYRVVAEFVDTTATPRIGLKGAAKVEGERVSLALFLFRRPLTALRQMVGW